MARQSKYFWPASAITEADMALLYQARESSVSKVSISLLIANAIRQVYAQGMSLPRVYHKQNERKLT